MKNFLPITVLLFLFACNDAAKKGPENIAKPENGLEAASQFIRAALNGDVTRARTFILKDSTNKQMLDLFEYKYNNVFSPEDRKAYKTASIHFMKDPYQVNDSTTIVYYSNSYKNVPDSLKVVKINGQWFIDMNFMVQPKDTISR
jgi:hypothetical protein